MLTLVLTLSLLGQTPSWEHVDQLTNQQKYEAAAKAAEARLAAARKAGDDVELAKGLITLTQLRVALGGAETAVKQLKAERWPTSDPSRTAVELFYAQSLDNYLETYGYEVRQRERVDTKGEVDLKAWTAEQLRTELHRTYEAVWRRREALGRQPLGALAGYLTPNDYPAGVRDTLRDAVTYLWTRELAQSSWWSPEHANEVFRLDFEALLAGDPSRSRSVALADEAVHPLARAGALLDDLEAWHARAGRLEAVLHARLTRLSLLRDSFTHQDERDRIAAQLEARIAKSAALPFSAYARSVLSEWYRDDGHPVRARDVAAVGARAFPSSVGGRRCAHLVAALEAPSYALSAMAVDGPGKRSVEVSSKNLRRLYLRAYRLDVARVLPGTVHGSVLPTTEELRALLGGTPQAAWTVELPATPDLVSHRTVVTPPLSTEGLYAILASVNEGFVDASNHLVAAVVSISHLVLGVRQAPDTSAEVVVSDGATGAPLSGVKVQLWSLRWDRPKKLVDTQTSDADGVARFKGGRSTESQYFLVARRGDEVSIDEGGLSFWRQEEGKASAALVYTDRSIYRPTQKVLWKVVGWKGHASTGRLESMPGAKLTVRLMDPNWQEVATTSVRTNDFASASGEFEVPTGRLLGSWHLEVRQGTASLGQAVVRVEEYKRPTFEATFRAGGPPVRLNSPVSLTGEARYHFGLPVTSGKVTWRVQRTPVYPWYWWRWWGMPETRPQVVASGTGALKDDGTFAVDFTPAADPKLAKDVTYTYAVSADVTDEGGETRQASTSMRVGAVSVEATFALEEGFFLEGKPVSVAVRRQDLSGVGRAGKGTWRVVALTQPSKALLPADEAPARDPRAPPPSLVTPGDEVRSRMNPGYSPEATVRGWPDGAEHSRGQLDHGLDGAATLTLPALPAGAWRVYYETKDDFGATWAMSQELLVSGEARLPVQLPALLQAERTSVEVGATARFLVGSASSGQQVLYEVYRANRLVERRWLTAGEDGAVVARPVTAEDRGGFVVAVTVVRDWQVMRQEKAIHVPWENKQLSLEFSTFRDLLRPGAKETFRVTVKGQGQALEAGTAEVLAYMFDQSLDLFGPHTPPSVPGLYPHRAYANLARVTLGPAEVRYLSQHGWFGLPDYPSFREDGLNGFDRWGIGGMGRRRFGFARSAVAEDQAVSALAGAPPAEANAAPPMPPSAAAPMPSKSSAPVVAVPGAREKQVGLLGGAGQAEAQAAQVPLRASFAETAFFAPHLLVDGKGEARIDFTVPDSLTAWNVWAHAVTKDLRGGSTTKVTRSAKDLMVRPYLPRFLREGDQASLKVVVNNASKVDLTGELLLDIVDPDTQASVAADFGHRPAPQPFSVKAGQGATVTVPLTAPKRVGLVAFKVVAKAGDVSDGELRPVPLLPSRVRLAQSRFVTLKDQDSRTMRFEDLAKREDPTRIDEQLVVTVDAQLFYSVLSALPYLVRYPYECSEQTLNRFLSTGIVSSVFRDAPAVADMGRKLAQRTTRYESFDALDPNRRLALEESPWLLESQGKAGPEDDELIAMLDPKVVEAERARALEKLTKLQTPQGGFPWFPGGPPSEYITTYVLHGFARALEFKVDVPRDLVVRAWRYVAADFRDDVRRCMAQDGCWEYITFLNYVASSFPDESWLGGAFTAEERQAMLDFSFKHWKQHSPYLKGMLTLTLVRAQRTQDARLVFDSVMDSSKTTRDDGTFWQPEDRAWLWYNDTIESHAFALRVLQELDPKDARRAGLVQWLLLNKKLNHWKSTKATAEVLYSMVKYLQAEQALGVKEESRVAVGPVKKTFVFSPDEYTGRKNQLVIPGTALDPATQSVVTVSKSTKGLQFASATWHFSTEQLPREGSGDLFHVERRYFKRVKQGTQTTLQPLAEGAKLEPGDELEVQLSIRARQAAEYVHLRDPRGAGFEPENATSRYRWDLGVARYEEFRDSATNFFFERLPAGEYTMKYRVRAAMAGTFRVGPATLQSMYAPEFTAYSAGHALSIATGGR